MVFFLLYGRKGLFGPWWRVPAAVTYPIVLLLMTSLIYLYPFDVFVFTHNDQDERPPFATKRS